MNANTIIAAEGLTPGAGETFATIDATNSTMLEAGNALATEAAYLYIEVAFSAANIADIYETKGGTARRIKSSELGTEARLSVPIDAAATAYTVRARNGSTTVDKVIVVEAHGLDLVPPAPETVRGAPGQWSAVAALTLDVGDPVAESSDVDVGTPAAILAGVACRRSGDRLGRATRGIPRS